MFKKNFVIHGFPRTGTTFVRGNLQRYFDAGFEVNHDPGYVPNDSNFTAVITKRRDVFSALCSHFVMLHTGEVSEYTNTKYPVFEVSPQQFEQFFLAHQDFYSELDLTHYKSVVELCYEDVIQDPYYLFGKFNIVEQTNYEFNKQCPHRYQDLISNLDALYSHYQKLINDFQEHGQ